MAGKTKAKKQSHTKDKQPIGSAFDLLGKSLDIVKKNWQVFAVVNILTIISAVGSASGNDHYKERGYWNYQPINNWGGLSGTQLAAIIGTGFLFVLIFLAIGIFLYAMSINLQVKSTSGKKPDLSELFEDGKKYFFRILGLSLLSGLIIIGGFILLIVPGIIALGRLVMAPYYMVDKDLGVMDAIKKSNDKAIGKMGLIYAAIGVTILVAIFAGIIGVIPVLGPLAGAAATIAYSLVLPFRYQQLKKA
ncbi:MAG TPA: hypothetical protein VFW77_02825 [Candidatus Saccharimonadales bacterium]|nr:hypothetical protein [Candidatus Saccharimonadales bacterium]